MPESNFIDYVKILCRSGKGGAGSRHFHRAKYVPKGGPDGGDGGRGGHILLRGNSHMWTLLPLRYRRHIFAGNGQSGSENRSSGKDGEDVTIDVPCGTVVFDAETGQYLCEVTDDGQIVPLLRGGRGGLGNWHFATATNRTPRYAQPGEPAIERTVILELKLLADVGLVGFPNAGKSTLLSAISAARPKIADYPFTTMEPQLGIVGYRAWDCASCATSSATRCCSSWCRPTPTTSPANTKYSSRSCAASTRSCSTSSAYSPYRSPTCSTRN